MLFALSLLIVLTSFPELHQGGHPVVYCRLLFIISSVIYIFLMTHHHFRHFRPG
jgi:hypothetical protein